MAFDSLKDFLLRLEKQNDLHRVTVPVDPELEMTEIASRCIREGRKALLFEKPIGSKFPVAMNFLSSDRRIETALGCHPQEVGERIVRLAEWAKAPAMGTLREQAPTAWRGLRSRPKTQKSGPVNENAPAVDLRALPVLKCWPDDGGRFFTLPLVITQDPEDKSLNMGMYRMQVKSLAETGMHIQIQRGAGVHLHKAEQRGLPLPCAVALGGDPVYTLAAAAPLPEGLDELMFAGYLRGKPVPLVRPANGAPYPANADFVLEGVIPCGVRKTEGPFGDHFGHYSLEGEFPVFQVKRLCHRNDAIYPATVVGKPPKEDLWMGNAVANMLTPLLRLIKPEVKSLWAWAETGFHNLAVAGVEQRYEKECVKTALGLMGEGQFSLTKCLVMVDPDCDPKNIEQVSERIALHFDPEKDFILIPGTPFDTLDFTSLLKNLGSKMIVDTTRRPGGDEKQTSEWRYPKIENEDNRIRRSRWIGPAILAVWSERPPRDLLKDLFARPAFAQEKILVCVSDDVDPDDITQVLWGIFTRFEPARDLVFESAAIEGVKPVYRGRMGIDATFKKTYPNPLVMPDEIVKKVDDRWKEYFA